MFEVLGSRCGRQLEKRINADAHVRFVWFRAWILPSGVAKVTSNRLLALSDSSSKLECKFSLAHVVRALSPGCLPYIRPNSETDALVLQVAFSDDRSSSRILANNLRLLS